jgi:hypothetical protein
MTPEEAIKIMCERCINYEVCQGTGCEPKKILIKEIEDVS